jgi:hypothetical protein
MLIFSLGVSRSLVLCSVQVITETAAYVSTFADSKEAATGVQAYPE